MTDRPHPTSNRGTLVDYLTASLDLVANGANDAGTLAAEHHDHPHARLATDLLQAAEHLVRTLAIAETEVRRS
jgi:hypothetical protein